MPFSFSPLSYSLYILFIIAGKEDEVQTMEHGGNAKVNAIFEARLAQANIQKPTNHADLQTRERFIRDKYERRKYYDPAAFASAGSIDAGPAPAAATHHFEADFGNALFSPTPAAAAVLGPPSDAARRRMEARGFNQGGQSSFGASDVQTTLDRTRNSSPKRVVRRTKSSEGPPTPISAAPVVVDLLDFQADFAAPSNNSGIAASASAVDLFNLPFATEPPAARARTPPPASASGRRRGETRTKASDNLRRSNSTEKLPIREPPRRNRSTDKLESPRRSKSSEKGPALRAPSMNADILSLYNSSPTPAQQQRQSFANGNGGGPMGNTMNSMPAGNGLNPGMSMQGIHNPMRQAGNMNQMHNMMQAMTMGSSNGAVAGNNNIMMMSGISSSNGLPSAPNLSMSPPNMMQQQQYQQQQMLLYQQQQMLLMQQQQQRGGMPNAAYTPATAVPKQAFDPNDPFADLSTGFPARKFR
jgi:hypothetical protein